MRSVESIDQIGGYDEDSFNIFTKNSKNGREWYKNLQNTIEAQLRTEMKQRAETAVKPIIEIQKKSVPEIVFDFGLEYARNAIDAMVMDEFTCCFNIEKPKPWNWNFELFLGWIFGGLIRFLILVPLRLCSFLIATLLFLGVFYFCFFTKFLVPRLYFYLDMPKILRVGTKIWLRFWLFMIGAIVKYHGKIPPRKKNQIFVSNHTSLMDYIIIASSSELFSTVGQLHTGFVGFLQTHIMNPLLFPIWFQRFEARDRGLTKLKIEEHINNTNLPRLLIFPEGVCVNNQYIVMFKKGVFEIEDVEIVPICVKYKKIFSDPYWPSKYESFLSHLFRLMRCWCTICDVHFLDPVKMQEGETPEEFANRVQLMIAKKGNFKICNKNGYFKYYTPSENMQEDRQRFLAYQLTKVLAAKNLKLLNSDKNEIGL